MVLDVDGELLESVVSVLTLRGSESCIYIYYTISSRAQYSSTHGSTSPDIVTFQSRRYEI